MKRLKGIMNIGIYFFGQIIFAFMIAKMFNFSKTYQEGFDFYCIVFVVLAIVLVICNFQFLKQQFKDNFFKFDTYKYGIIGFILLLTIAIINFNIFTNLDPNISKVSNNEAEITKLIANTSKIQVLLVVGLLAPFIEEIIFRASLMGVLIGDKIKDSYMPYIGCALVFTLFHDASILSNPFNIQAIYYFTMYFIPSIVLCLMYKKTNHNLVAVIIIHMLNNSITLFI